MYKKVKKWFSEKSSTGPTRKYENILISDTACDHVWKVTNLLEKESKKKEDKKEKLETRERK